MAYNRKDHYFKKAKEQDFVARSVFKLDEMDQRHKILRPGDKVLDLGAAPGSWAQYTSTRVGSKGRVLGLDLQAVRVTLPNAFFAIADLREEGTLERVMTESGITPPFDVVLSDMAPRTTGIRTTDQARSLELCELALALALRYVKVGGHFVCKLFHGQEFEEFRKTLRASFEKVEASRPDATRKESKEIFLIALKRRAPAGG